MPISSFTGSILRVLPSDGVTFTGAHPCLFLITCFQLLCECTGPNLCRNSIRTQRGRSSGWDSRALSPGQLSDRGPQSTQRLLCTCQSNCDTNNLLGDMGDTLRGERGERSSIRGAVPRQQVTPALGPSKTSHNKEERSSWLLQVERMQM